jgi:DNA-binding response OmpR family regulator
MARVLVVDDECQMRELLRQALERHGHVVDEAGDGKEALQHFAEQRPDIVLTDLVMPGKEGIETIQALRRQSPTMPIIAMSGGGRVGPDEYLSLAGLLGANRTFAKPFRLEEILTAVRELTAKTT